LKHKYEWYDHRLMDDAHPKRARTLSSRVTDGHRPSRP